MGNRFIILRMSSSHHFLSGHVRKPRFAYENLGGFSQWAVFTHLCLKIGSTLVNILERVIKPLTLVKYSRKGLKPIKSHPNEVQIELKLHYPQKRGQNVYVKGFYVMGKGLTGKLS